MWLAQVQSGAWEGRYAAYEDEHVSLEFCLTGEKAKGRQSPLVVVLGPFAAHRSMEVIEPRVVRDLDLHNAGALRDKPLVVACVADQPWQLNDGYLRDFLYGRPSRTLADDLGSSWTFGGAGGPCAFRDPLYAGFSALLLIDRDPARPTELKARAWLNPWARVPVRPSDLAFTAFGPAGADEVASTSGPRTTSTEAAAPTMRWYVGKREALQIG
jgi:hypothetical protein